MKFLPHSLGPDTLFAWEFCWAVSKGPFFSQQSREAISHTNALHSPFFWHSLWHWTEVGIFTTFSKSLSAISILMPFRKHVRVMSEKKEHITTMIHMFLRYQRVCTIPTDVTSCSKRTYRKILNIRPGLTDIFKHIFGGLYLGAYIRGEGYIRRAFCFRICVPKILRSIIISINCSYCRQIISLS